jgi:hypothetical protein
MEMTPFANDNKTTGPMQTAKHLAARAIVALRVGFRVEQIALGESEGLASGIKCDWKCAKGSCEDDATLICRGFAFVYVGSLIDQKTAQAISEDIRKELNADMVSVQEAREAAVEWGIVPSVMDTNPFAHLGYKLASRIIRADAALIDKLAAELLEKKVIAEKDLLVWFKDNASPCSLEEMEQSITF